MNTVISRLCDLVHDKRRTLLLVWLCFVVAAVPLALHQTDYLSAGNYIIPGSQSAFVDAEAAVSQQQKGGAGGARLAPQGRQAFGHPKGH